MGWNKQEEVSSERYREHIKQLSSGALSLRSHWRAVIKHEGEEYELLIPSYDIGTVTEILAQYRKEPSEATVTE